MGYGGDGRGCVFRPPRSNSCTSTRRRPSAFTSYVLTAAAEKSCPGILTILELVPSLVGELGLLEDLKLLRDATAL